MSTKRKITQKIKQRRRRITRQVRLDELNHRKLKLWAATVGRKMSDLLSESMDFIFRQVLRGAHIRRSQIGRMLRKQHL